MRRAPRSITEFLTDASLVQLCSALGDMARARLSLHDEKGRRIDYTGGSPPWSLGPDDEEASRIAAVLRGEGDPHESVTADGRVIEPIIVARRAIGAVVIDAEAGRHASGDLDGLRSIVRKLLQTVSELCDQEVALRHRNAELSVLFRLSSFLVGTRDVGTLLTSALRSALEILGASAGVVHLLDGDGGASIKAHVNLPDALLESARSAPPQSDAFRKTMARGGFPGMVAAPLVFSGRPLGELRLLWKHPAFLDPDEQALLQAIVEQVSAAVGGANLVESERLARAVQRQLALASDVQRRMLPQSVPVMPRLDVDARYIPTMQLGGDFYDLIDLSGHLGILIGDVAGKGVPAALLMAAVRASLRAHAADVYHLDEIMSRVNKAMARDTMPNEFATIFYGVLDPSTLRLTYCNAGHDPPLLLRLPHGRPPETRDLYELTAGGMVVGVDPAQTYARGMFDLAPGDVLVAYTDGIVDARNFESKRFGRERLRKSILATITADPRAGAKAIADHIIWEVRRYIGLNPQADDETLVVVRVRE